MSNKTNGKIAISATPEQIMDVLADLENYSAWTEGIKSCEITETNDDGRPVKADWSFSASVLKDDYTLAYTWTDTSIAWTLVEGNVLKLQDGSYELTDQGNGKVEVYYELEVEANIPMPGLLKKRAEKKIVNTALKGLKQRVESLN